MTAAPAGEGRRPSGRSSIYQADNGRWHGWGTMGTRADGSPDRRYREGATEAEVAKKVADLMTVLRMSRSETYEQIRAGHIQTVKQGRATFITVGDVAAYVKLTKPEAEAA